MLREKEDNYEVPLQFQNYREWTFYYTHRFI
jgi:hypothetical protein